MHQPLGQWGGLEVWKTEEETGLPTRCSVFSEEKFLSPKSSALCPHHRKHRGGMSVPNGSGLSLWYAKVSSRWLPQVSSAEDERGNRPYHTCRLTSMRRIFFSPKCSALHPHHRKHKGGMSPPPSPPHPTHLCHPLSPPPPPPPPFSLLRFVCCWLLNIPATC